MNQHRIQISEFLELPENLGANAERLEAIYQNFLSQLKIARDSRHISSDPEFFSIETDGIAESVQNWKDNLSQGDKDKLLLLSILCRPFDVSCLTSSEDDRFIDDEWINHFFVPHSVSLSEDTTSLPFGIGELDELRFVKTVPTLNELLERTPKSSELKTWNSEFIGGPGNYAYQAWQIANWSDDWAAVYSITDGGHTDGYPFPWLLGFINKDAPETNFVALLKANPSWGYYCTFGHIDGPWSLVTVALTACDDMAAPDWGLVEALSDLTEQELSRLMKDNPCSTHDIIYRLQELRNEAYDAGIEEDSFLRDMFSRAGTASIDFVERVLPWWQTTHDLELEELKEAKEEALGEYRDLIEPLVRVIVGPRPGGNMALGWGDRASHVHRYIENHVLAHSELPTGKLNLGTTEKKQRELGIVDFDDAVRILREEQSYDPNK
jgi:hypothetical protein